MTDRPTIELPRLDGESARAYAARVEYVTMGPQRSQEAVSQKLGKSRQLMYRWATRYHWTEHAERYDETIYTLATRQRADKYIADIEEHRKRADDAGKALYTVAGQLIKQVNAALVNPRKIKGEDGKSYTLHGIDFTANTFAIAARAMQTALDLEAHALGVDKLLPSLEHDSE